jgi:CRISPR system Cascade subunit CasB
MVMSLEAADKYVAYVQQKVKADPGRRSALRRSLGRPVEDVAARRAHSVVAPWLPSDRTRPAVESAYYSVAALIAAQPRGRGDQTDATTEAEEQAAVEAVPLAQDEPADRIGDKTTATKKAVRPSASLGSTLGRAVRDKKFTSDTVEARLHLLCRQDVAGLHRMLPGLVRQLAAKEVAPDWGRLLVDLSRWERDRGQVTKWWLQDFYRTIHQAEQNDDNDSDSSESEDR